MIRFHQGPLNESDVLRGIQDFVLEGPRDITSLTEKTAPDQEADFFAIFDAAAGVVKKALPVNFPGIVQVETLTTGSVSTTTNTIPSDDSIPTATEGAEIMTLGIEPLATDNTLLIFSRGAFAHSGNPVNMTMTLINSAATAATGVVRTGGNRTGDGRVWMDMLMTKSVTSTATQTYRIRMGSELAGTITFNGGAGVREFGGIIQSGMVILELST